jgi:hypothetical protein
MGPKRKPGDNPRPLVVRLTRQDHAYNLIQAARPLKGKRPNKGEIKITPQNPDRTRFERAKMGEFAYLARSQNPKAKIAVKNYHLIIDGNTIIDSVKAPTVETILTQTIEEEEKCRELKFYKTEVKVD